MNKSITQAPGASEVALRLEIVSYAGAATLGQDPNRGLISKDLLPYLNKVIHHAYKVTNADVERLKRRAYFEDDLYEITISAAFGAGYARYQKGMSLLNQNER